jgi:hypothetical protein
MTTRDYHYGKFDDHAFFTKVRTLLPEASDRGAAGYHHHVRKYLQNGRNVQRKKGRVKRECGAKINL